MELSGIDLSGIELSGLELGSKPAYRIACTRS